MIHETIPLVFVLIDLVGIKWICYAEEAGVVSDWFMWSLGIPLKLNYAIAILLRFTVATYEGGWVLNLVVTFEGDCFSLKRKWQSIYYKTALVQQWALNWNE